MQVLQTTQGQAVYGPKYRDMEYFQLKHAAAAYDPRGDQVCTGRLLLFVEVGLVLLIQASNCCKFLLPLLLVFAPRCRLTSAQL